MPPLAIRLRIRYLPPKVLPSKGSLRTAGWGVGAEGGWNLAAAGGGASGAPGVGVGATAGGRGGATSDSSTTASRYIMHGSHLYRRLAWKSGTVKRREQLGHRRLAVVWCARTRATCSGLAMPRLRMTWARESLRP